MITPLSLQVLLEELTILMEPFAYYEVSEHDGRLFVYSQDIMTQQVLTQLADFAALHNVKCSGVEPHDSGVRYFMYL